MNVKLSDEEFVDHCIKHSSDPNILRLARILDSHMDAMRRLRKYVRINSLFEVDDNYQWVELTDYVCGVIEENQDYRETISQMTGEISDYKKEIHALKSRTLEEFVKETQATWNNQRRELEYRVASLTKLADSETKRADRERARTEDLAEKLGMWDILKTDFQKPN